MNGQIDMFGWEGGMDGCVMDVWDSVPVNLILQGTRLVYCSYMESKV